MIWGCIRDFATFGSAPREFSQNGVCTFEHKGKTVFTATYVNGLPRLPASFIIRPAGVRRAVTFLTEAVTAATPRCCELFESFLWHKRLGHLGYTSLKRLRSMVKGLNVPDSELQRLVNDKPLCDPCVRGKSTMGTRPAATMKQELSAPWSACTLTCAAPWKSQNPRTNTSLA